MPRGKKPFEIPQAEWKVYVPVDVAAKIDLLLLDPVTKKPGYGKRSALVSRLLTDWLGSRVRISGFEANQFVQKLKEENDGSQE